MRQQQQPYQQKVYTMPPVVAPVVPYVNEMPIADREEDEESELNDFEICLAPVMIGGRAKPDPELANITVDGNCVCVPHLVREHGTIPAIRKFQDTMQMTTKEVNICKGEGACPFHHFLRGLQSAFHLHMVPLEPQLVASCIPSAGIAAVAVSWVA